MGNNESSNSNEGSDISYGHGDIQGGWMAGERSRDGLLFIKTITHVRLRRASWRAGPSPNRHDALHLVIESKNPAGSLDYTIEFLPSGVSKRWGRYGDVAETVRSYSLNSEVDLYTMEERTSVAALPFDVRTHNSGHYARDVWGQFVK